MRRLQGNLTYLAGLADRKGGQVPQSPQFLTAPPLNFKIKMRSQPPMAGDSNEKQLDANEDRLERDQFLKELYRKLQGLFPGVDPRKEAALQTGSARGGQANASNQQRIQNGQRQVGDMGSNQVNQAPTAPLGIAGQTAATTSGAVPAPGLAGQEVQNIPGTSGT
ncbi:hypothetical protein VTK73DRAFT_2335 [Phialemonium thermophilum]|uniref:Uncharacterized protein n=1 Tax=Phialemonium thermophilum TaxID=223376 RepID=A0ABR3X4Z7_9PEZI